MFQYLWLRRIVRSNESELLIHNRFPEEHQVPSVGAGNKKLVLNEGADTGGHLLDLHILKCRNNVFGNTHSTSAPESKLCSSTVPVLSFLVPSLVCPQREIDTSLLSASLIFIPRFFSSRLLITRTLEI